MKTTISVLAGMLILCLNQAVAQKMTVKDDASNILMEVNDEGSQGSISLPSMSSDPASATGKLYNRDGALYWNGSALGTAGSAGGWTDGGANVVLSTSSDKVGIGAASPEFKLSLDNDGGILAKGVYGSGADLTTSGAGARLIWYPKKSAFRAGFVTGTQWNNASIGDASIAMGANPTASGGYSVALGSATTASADYSMAMGLATVASGLYSTALGAYTAASGGAATALGGFTTASGSMSTAMGFSTKAESYTGFAVGRYNLGGGTVDSWVTSDPVFEIGIGSDTQRANAMTVLKNGKVGIGDSSPSNVLQVKGKIGITDENNSDFQVLYLPDQSDYTGTLIVGTGGGSLSHTSGVQGMYNTALGIGALESITSGVYTTAVGYHALYNGITNETCTAVGYQALYNGSYNSTAVGYQALRSGGSWSVAVGRLALSNATGSDNTAIGNEALANNSSGGGNTAGGWSALYSNSTGGQNTAFGYYSLNANTTGIKNTALGYYANVSSNNLENATVIGAEAVVNASNKVVIGSSSVTSIGGYADWTNFSDKRYKENISYKDDLGLDFILKLNTASYNYKDDKFKRRRDGLIAQDVEAVLSELGVEFSGLVVDDDDKQTMNLSYGSFVIPLINAVKTQQAEIEALKAEIRAMK